MRARAYRRRRGWRGAFLHAHLPFSAAFYGSSHTYRHRTTLHAAAAAFSGSFLCSLLRTLYLHYHLPADPHSSGSNAFLPTCSTATFASASAATVALSRLPLPVSALYPAFRWRCSLWFGLCYAPPAIAYSRRPLVCCAGGVPHAFCAYAFLRAAFLPATFHLPAALPCAAHTPATTIRVYLFISAVITLTAYIRHTYALYAARAAHHFARAT